MSPLLLLFLDRSWLFRSRMRGRSQDSREKNSASGALNCSNPNLKTGGLSRGPLGQAVSWKYFQWKKLLPNSIAVTYLQRYWHDRLCLLIRSSPPLNLLDSRYEMFLCHLKCPWKTTESHFCAIIYCSKFVCLWISGNQMHPLLRQ